MKFARYLLLIATLCACGVAQALPARVQTCTGKAVSGTAATCVFGSNVTSGNLIVVFGAANSSSSLTGQTITGSGGCSGTYTTLGTASDGTTSTGSIIYSTPVSSSAACTVSWGGAADGIGKGVIAYEVSGTTLGTSPNDGAPVFFASGVFSSPGPVTESMSATSNANDILLGMVQVSDTASNFTYTTVQSGWTADAVNATTGTAMYCHSEYQVVSSTGTYTAGWSTITQTGGGSRYFRLSAVAIKSAGAAGGFVPSLWLIN